MLRTQKTSVSPLSCFPCEEISTGFRADAARSVQSQQLIQSQDDRAATGGARGGETGGGGGKERERRTKKSLRDTEEVTPMLRQELKVTKTTDGSGTKFERIKKKRKMSPVTQK